MLSDFVLDLPLRSSGLSLRSRSSPDPLPFQGRWSKRVSMYVELCWEIQDVLGGVMVLDNLWRVQKMTCLLDRCFMYLDRYNLIVQIRHSVDKKTLQNGLRVILVSCQFCVVTAHHPGPDEMTAHHPQHLIHLHCLPVCISSKIFCSPR